MNERLRPRIMIWLVLGMAGLIVLAQEALRRIGIEASRAVITAAIMLVVAATGLIRFRKASGLRLVFKSDKTVVPR